MIFSSDQYPQTSGDRDDTAGTLLPLNTQKTVHTGSGDLGVASRS